MDQQQLEHLVAEGKSIAEISALAGKSKTAVRYWLKEFNLVTTGKAGKKKQVIINSSKICTKCGISKPLMMFSLWSDRPGTYFASCKQCIRDDTQNRTHKVKSFLVTSFGGICNRCKGSFLVGQYDFHHTEPEHKDFTIGENRLKSLDSVLRELEKCVMLCANCHQLTHSKMKSESGEASHVSTDRWNAIKKAKLDFMGVDSCSECGYTEYSGALAIVLPERLKHYRKYNKAEWDQDFKDALKQAKVSCLNCLRKSPTT